MNNFQKDHNHYLLRKKLLGRILKIFLIAVVIGLAVWIGTNLFYGKVRALFFNLIASNLLNIEVKPAIISGVTSKGLKYNITSETIENYISNFFYKNNVNFAKPIIKLELENGNTLNVSSKMGQFDESKNLFYLKNKVSLLSSDGAYLESSLITIDLNKSEMFTNEKTVAIDDGNHLYSKGFILYNNFNNLTIYGPVVVSDKTIVKDNFYNSDIFKDIYLKTSKDIFVDNKNKTISTSASFYGFKDNVKYSADSFKANYNNLGTLKSSKNSLDHFSRIEMASNVNVYNKQTDGVLKGDKYIYDVNKKIMVLTSKNKRTTYEDAKYFVSVTDRFEFNTEKHTVVARGKPKLISKSKNSKSYDISANLAYAKLTPKNNDVEYAEIFDNILIKSYDKSKIYADYGYLDYKENILYLEDNIKIVDAQKNVIKGCKLVLDIKSGATKLVKCNNQDTITTTFNKNQKKNNKR